ncbi:MFS transporter [Streptomyces populi]|uniref:MFS transporter n=1 Tax=Streptomyces populi TaxID=2058924 RepID=A0A2I0SHC0_9ACTN|nr:MFS transporter [Streptomyces populi]PKT69323.1 MFS transporter [Streptomyces populi]
MLKSFRQALPTGRGVPAFAGATFANSVGMGIYYPFSLLFFQSVLDTSLTRIGAALTVSALLALPLLPYVGRLIDRFGPRRVLLVSTTVRAAAFAGYLLVDSLAPFLALSVLVALTMRTEQAATPALAKTLAEHGGEPAGRWMALSRALFNAGFGLGALTAGLVASASPEVLHGVGAGNAVCIAAAALLYLALPASRPAVRAAGAEEAGRARPWRSGPFRGVVAAGAGLWIIAVSIETALPVHLVRGVGAPAWTTSVLFTVNTVLLAVFQVPVAHRVERVRPAVLVAAGALLHIALPAALAVAGRLAPTPRTAVLVAAMALYTLGELIASQAVTTLLTALAPDERRGSYLAFNQLFIGLANALTPLLVTSALDRGAGTLWWLLTGCALAVALLMAGGLRGVAAERTPSDEPQPARAEPVTP